MKPITLLLSASLLANLTLVGFLALRAKPAAAPRAGRSAPLQTSSPGSAGSGDAIRAALAGGDVTALEAAGVPAALAREIAMGRAFSRLAEKIRASRARTSADERWWRSRPGTASANGRELQLAARRELADALVATFGDDLGLGENSSSQLGFLPAAKRDALRRINQDYDEMMAKFSGAGVQLPSDREKLRLLRLERERDIAAALTPEERVAYEMRTSPSGNLVRSRYGDAIETEAEFQKIYALQKAFDDQNPRDALSGRITPEFMKARGDAERQLDASIRAAVGEDRYAALRRSADPDVRTIDSLAQRLNLPAVTTDTVLASRDSFSAESQRIAADTSLTMQQRHGQIQTLANQAKADLTRTLGAEAAEAYAQRSPWMNMLQSGMAYSTAPQDGTPASLLPGGGQSVYPVMPAGAMPAGTQRPIVFSSVAPFEAGLAADPAAGGNVRVLSFSTSATTDSGAAPMGGGERNRGTGNVVPPANPPASGSVVTPLTAPAPTQPPPR